MTYTVQRGKVPTILRCQLRWNKINPHGKGGVKWNEYFASKIKDLRFNESLYIITEKLPITKLKLT